MNFNEFLDGSGRLGRKDYIVWSIIAWVIAAILSWVAGGNDAARWLSYVISLLPFVVGIFISIKRLHDIDKSGWFLLLALVPIVNIIFAIALLVWPGTPGDNRFGSPNSGSPFPALH